MKYLFALLACVVLFTAPCTSMGAGCSANNFETVCEEDSSCKWDSKKHKCTKKGPGTGCSSHTEFYCALNGCAWDSTKRKCTDKKT
jgi:hypothetical protein